MKTVSMCCRPSCNGCPSIREDIKNGIMYIKDGKKEIPFTNEEVQNLRKYLNQRG